MDGERAILVLVIKYLEVHVVKSSRTALAMSIYKETTVCIYLINVKIVSLLFSHLSVTR